MKNIIFHGEVAFYKVDKIPEDARIINVNNGYFVVGESETHGNDHRVSVDEKTKLFTKDDILFLESIGTEVYCPNKTRHDTITLPDGQWRVGHAQEFDYFEMAHRKVRD